MSSSLQPLSLSPHLFNPPSPLSPVDKQAASEQLLLRIRAAKEAGRTIQQLEEEREKYRQSYIEQGSSLLKTAQERDTLFVENARLKQDNEELRVANEALLARIAHLTRAPEVEAPTVNQQPPAFPHNFPQPSAFPHNFHQTRTQGFNQLARMPVVNPPPVQRVSPQNRGGHQIK